MWLLPNTLTPSEVLFQDKKVKHNINVKSRVLLNNLKNSKSKKMRHNRPNSVRASSRSQGEGSIGFVFDIFGNTSKFQIQSTGLKVQPNEFVSPEIKSAKNFELSSRMRIQSAGQAFCIQKPINESDTPSVAIPPFQIRKFSCKQLNTLPSNDKSQSEINHMQGPASCVNHNAKNRT